MRLFRQLQFFSVFLFVFFFFVSLSSPAFAQESSESSRLIVKFKTNTSVFERSNASRKVHARVEHRISRLNADSLTIDPKKRAHVLMALRANPFVEYVEDDAIAAKTIIPNDSFYANQWALAKINAPAAWNTTIGLDSVRIAIVDTGINPTHADLVGKIAARANFTTDADLDTDGHGTHVAGIAAAATNNSTGVAGVGFQSNLLSVKVLNSSGTGYYSWIASGIIWAADNGAKVINLSLGGTSPSKTLQDAVNYAWNKGVVVVSAAGNSNINVPFYPAYYTNVIAVGATGKTDAKATFSNWGSWVDLAAPGVDIYSTYKTQYAYMSGTSMAAPHVSGLAGLIASIHSDWSNTQIRNKLQASVDPVTGTGVYWSNGRINACKAVDCDITPVVSPSPSPSILPTPTPTPIASVEPSASPSAIPSPLPSITPTPVATASATPSATPIITPTPLPTPLVTPKPSPSPKPWYCAYIPTFPGCI